jgi:MscS family membrane protein
MIEGFWQEIQKVWDEGIFGTNLGDIFLAVGIFLTFIFARRLFFHTTVKSLKLMVRNTKTTLDDQVLAAIEQPLEFAFVVVGLYVAGQFVELSDTLAHILAQLVRSMIAIISRDRSALDFI